MQTDLGWLVERIIEKAKDTMKKNAPESAASVRQILPPLLTR